MFDHISLRVSSVDAYVRVFEPLLKTLGIEKSAGSETVAFWSDFALSEVIADRPPTTGAHVAFVAPSTGHVDDFWQAGIDAGLTDNGKPGPRPYTDSYYGAFLLDEAGNNFEAVHRDELRQGGATDHVALRVSDMKASMRFYQAIAGPAGLKVMTETPERALFLGNDGGVLSLVAGRPLTSNLHVAFGGDDDAVIAFHEQATGAGYLSNGSPGERPQYHEGFYAAYVFDPDGNNIEVCNHHR